MAVENANVDHDLDYLWLPSEFLTDDDILTDFKFANGLFGDPISSAVVESHDEEDDFFTEISGYSCSDLSSNEVWELPWPQGKGTVNSIIYQDCLPAFYATSLFPPLPPKPSNVTILRQHSQTQAPPSCYQPQQGTRNGGVLWQRRRRNANGLQQPMRAIDGPTKERKGTGVFMPRTFDSTCRQRPCH